jgi:hypothetical protein
MEERSQIPDRSKLDPDLTPKFAKMGRKYQPETFFKHPRIEVVAAGVIEDLNALKASMSDEELDEAPLSEDILVNIYNNNDFILKEVVPVAFAMLERTNQTAFMTDDQISGYCFICSGEDNDLEPTVYFVADDTPEGEFGVLNSPEEIQEAWDSSPKHIRIDLQVFADLTKREMIEKFIEFAADYESPKTA